MLLMCTWLFTAFGVSIIRCPCIFSAPDKPNEKVEDYLLRHPEFVDEYIRKNAFRYLKTEWSPTMTTNEFLLDVVRLVSKPAKKVV